MARYGKSFKNKYVARLLPPLNESSEVVARDAGIAAVTLERWRSEFLLLPASDQSWSGAARLDAVVTTAAMDEVSKSMVSHEGHLPSRFDCLAAKCDKVLGRAQRGGSHPEASQTGSLAHQGFGARVASQGKCAGRVRGPFSFIKKSRGDLPQGRGRVIVLEDRLTLSREIEVAHKAGARLRIACELSLIHI